MAKKNNPIQNILVVRPDRIGDVILSTPVFEAITRGIPRAKVTALVQWGVHELIEGLPGVAEVMPYDRRRSWSGWVSLFREKRFDAVIFLHPDPKLASAAFWAEIPFRVGPLSNWYSFLFFNKGIRQHRSRVEKHEAEYGLDLLAPLGIEASKDLKTQICVRDEARDWAREWLDQRGMDGTALKKMVIVHPGMGGSAQNWPMSNYRELVHRLVGSGYIVLGTFGPTEHALAAEIGLGERFSYFAQLGETLQHLVGLMCFARVVVAPSTGPLHIAVALGKRVVTLFPELPIQQSAKRWGPFNGIPDRVSVLSPLETTTVQAAYDQVMLQFKYENENPSTR